MSISYNEFSQSSTRLFYNGADKSTSIKTLAKWPKSPSNMALSILKGTPKCLEISISNCGSHNSHGSR